MTRPHAEPPAEIVDLARARSEARAARDWDRADALRSELEAAGWKVVDHGTAFALEPVAPPTIEDGETVRYGAAAAVPSVLEDPPSARFTVELVADDWPDDLTRMLAGLRAHAPDGTQVVIVANDPGPVQASRLATASADLAPIAGVAPEVAWTSDRLGHAAARNIGLRRARGALVVLADPSVEPAGDALTPLERALDDPAIAVAGAFGLVSTDLRRFDDGMGPEVDLIGLDWMAFRRADYVSLGPLDEKFAFYRGLDAWWSLVLRAGADESASRGARRVELPLARHAHRGWTSLRESERDRQAKRNYYRVLDQFRGRPDLLAGSRAGSATTSGLEPQG